MKRILILALSLTTISWAWSQEKPLTKEMLWKLGRVNPVGLSKDGQTLYYSVSTADIEQDKLNTVFYKTDLNGTQVEKVEEVSKLLPNRNLSPNGGNYLLSYKNVKLEKLRGKDLYPTLTKSQSYVFDALDYKHWDHYNEGNYQHLFLTDTKNNESVDLLEGQPYYSPQMPFGGDEDFTWSLDGRKVVYVSKKKSGTSYALSTNTDLYEYDIDSKTTKNITEENLGYDTNPSFSANGHLTWLQMKTDGYESDKKDLIVNVNGKKRNLTQHWDGTVDSYKWSLDGKKIFFVAPIDGTVQLFEISFVEKSEKAQPVKQLTHGIFDVGSIVGFTKNKIILTRSDFNTASEIYSYDLKSAKWNRITHVNDSIYKNVAKSTVEKRYITTTDGKKMLTWVILPPNFDKNKKYPALLYCQGGPQAIVSPFYSFRWNFQLMAAEGYVVVAPNRRGLPGFGQQWNKAISKDWAGQPMKDYLSAIDNVSQENYVDKNRLGAVGASYGGYSVYYLAGIHQKRFKSFIAHCGVFDLQSMYGTTEEVFFPNYDMGGAYWDKDNKDAQNAYKNFNPINNVDRWDTPILVIHGGNDFRVPLGQGQEAFQAAQLRGIKSRFLFLPDENHWVLKPQNALIWQGEFFRWLKETL